MLRTIFLSLTLILLPFVSLAKMAKWLMYPEYESIEFRDNGLIEICKDSKCGLIKQNGNIIVDISYDEISEFNENIAMLYRDGKFVGFTDRTGKIVDLEMQNYKVAYPEIGFSEGYLVVEKDSEYYYIDYDGKEVFGPFAAAYPFFEGYAVVVDYENLKKKNDSQYNSYISKQNNGIIKFPQINPGDINFVSSFHDGKAIVAVRKKFYILNTENIFDFTPIDIQGPKKNIPVVLQDKVVNIQPQKFGFTIEAKNGVFNFDPYMRPLSYKLQEQEMVDIPYPQKVEKNYDSHFSKFTDEDKWGLKYYDTEVLPPQFEQVRSMRGDLAIVAINGKYGIIVVDKDAEFKFKFNNNEDIGFMHKYFDSKVTLTLPTFIKAASASFMSLSPDCEVNKETRKESETLEGNYITYECRLTVPQHLTNELSPHIYKFAVKYDGLTSPVYEVPVKEWYVRLYEVEIPEKDYLMGIKDSINVEFEIVSIYPDAGKYFKTVGVEAINPLSDITLSKISENHFSFNLKYVETERLPFVVTVAESECPIIRYPFEAVFTPDGNRSRKLRVSITPMR